MRCRITLTRCRKNTFRLRIFQCFKCMLYFSSYTASHNDVLFISKATKKNNFNSRTVSMDHEKLHDSFCVCVHVRSVSPIFRKKRDFLEKGYFKGFERIKEKSSTRLTSQKCRNHQHESLVLNQSKSINQSINHVSEVSA